MSRDAIGPEEKTSASSRHTQRVLHGRLNYKGRLFSTFIILGFTFFIISVVCPNVSDRHHRKHPNGEGTNTTSITPDPNTGINKDPGNNVTTVQTEPKAPADANGQATNIPPKTEVQPPSAAATASDGSGQAGVVPAEVAAESPKNQENGQQAVPAKGGAGGGGRMLEAAAGEGERGGAKMLEIGALAEKRSGALRQSSAASLRSSSSSTGIEEDPI